MLDLHRVVKRNKRLHVARSDTGQIVYTPPDFLRIDNRAQLEALAMKLDEGEEPIQAIMAFEQDRPCRHVGR